MVDRSAKLSTAGCTSGGVLWKGSRLWRLTLEIIRENMKPTRECSR